MISLALPRGNIHLYEDYSLTNLLVYIYLISQVSVYRTIGPLVCLDRLHGSLYVSFVPFYFNEKRIDC